MKPLVPSNPGPPKDPKSFWAPWPAIREPCATRTIIGADSLTLEVFTLAPSVAFSGLASLVLGDEDALVVCVLYTRNHLGSPFGFHSCPSTCTYSAECVEGLFSEVRLYGVLRSSA